jgi:hypothetical protein
MRNFGEAKVIAAADLKCGRCPVSWSVTHLLVARITVKCPTCGEPNDIWEAVKRGLMEMYDIGLPAFSRTSFRKLLAKPTLVASREPEFQPFLKPALKIL